MSTQTASSPHRPGAIDPVWAFRSYAILAGLAGIGLLGWGGVWFGSQWEGEPWSKALLIRLLGVQLIAAACWAVGFALVDGPLARRRGLFWFAAGHLVIWIGLVLARRHGDAGPSEEAVSLLAMVLLYLWSTAEGEDLDGDAAVTLFGRGRQTATGLLRSQYERQIREAAQQEERNRLARDLHDSVRQQIFAIQTAAAAAQVRMDSGQPGTGEALEQVRTAARQAGAEMQAMLDQLRAAPLENAGLIDSIRSQCEALGYRTGAHVDCRIGHLPPAHKLLPGTHSALQRVAQEALSNVARHARAHHVELSLDSGSGAVELRIRDDGAGFDPAARDGHGGQGLANMRARADEFGGVFGLDSRPGGGTTIDFSIPYPADQPVQDYALRARVWGVVLAAAALALVWRVNLVLAAPVAIALIGFGRNWLAWRQARRAAEAAS